MSMTNSKTQSIGNNEIPLILANYLNGRYTLGELQERLKGYIVIHFT